MTLKDRIVDTPWADLSLGERIRHLEVEGYLVIPSLLSAHLVQQLRRELANVPTVGADYTDRKQTHNDIQWAGGSITELIAHPPAIEFLSELFGDVRAKESRGPRQQDPHRTMLQITPSALPALRRASRPRSRCSRSWVAM